MKKGQIGVEYLSLAAFVITMITLGLILAVVFLNYNSEVVRADDVGKTIMNIVNEVHAAGPGAVKEIILIIPGDINSTILDKKTIGWIINVGVGDFNAVKTVDANVVGSLPTTSGTHTIRVEALPSGFVQVGTDLSVSPRSSEGFLLAGDKNGIVFTLSNNSGRTINNIVGRMTGDFNSISNMPAVVSSLAVGASGAVQVDFNIPADQNADLLEGVLMIESGSASTAGFISVTVPRRLNDANINFFRDDDYTSDSNQTTRGKRIYYKIMFYDSNSDLIGVEDFDITIADSNSLGVKDINALTARNGIYKSSYYVSPDANLGTWTLRVDSNKYASRIDTNTFRVSG